MNPGAQFAKHLREVYTGGNWTAVNLKDTLAGINYEEAFQKLESFNSIAALVYHINYYVRAILHVLREEPLTAHDKYSFDVPAINSEQDWNTLKEKTFFDAEETAVLVEQLPDERFNEIFFAEKYGTYQRNVLGLIEHTHYHLGQIVILIKLIRGNKNAPAEPRV